MNPRAHREGFTLIELLVAVSLFGLLLALAVSQYVNFISNAQVRNAAEAMLNGVLSTQTAAINANTQAQLTVAPTGWQIAFVNPDTSIPAQTPQPPAPYLITNGAPQALVTTTPNGATEITFDAFGRIVPNADTSQTVSCIKVNGSSASSRPLMVIVSNSTQATGTKLCDPAAAATEPQACPAVNCG
jgi:type IV fimbrial biogenesis protein FimT